MTRFNQTQKETLKNWPGVCQTPLIGVQGLTNNSEVKRIHYTIQNKKAVLPQEKPRDAAAALIGLRFAMHSL